MLGVVHATDSVSGKPNVVHHTITVLIKFFLFLELVFFSHFDPQKINFSFFPILLFFFLSFLIFYTSIDYDIVLQTWLEASH